MSMITDMADVSAIGRINKHSFVLAAAGYLCVNFKLGERGPNFQDTGDIEMSVYSSDTGIKVKRSFLQAAAEALALRCTQTRHSKTKEHPRTEKTQTLSDPRVLARRTRCAPCVRTPAAPRCRDSLSCLLPTCTVLRRPAACPGGPGGAAWAGSGWAGSGRASGLTSECFVKKVVTEAIDMVQYATVRL